MRYHNKWKEIKMQPVNLSLHFFVLIILTSVVLSSFSQNITNNNLKNNLTEKITEHVVPNGIDVHPLPNGLPIEAFSKGGAKEKELEDFIKNLNVAGLIILQNGEIRLERYAQGHSASQLWPSLSVAKSVTSTLAGIAIHEGFIHSVNDYVTEYLPDLKGSAYDSVKVVHLLTMTTGIRWNENYTDPNSDIIRISTDSIESGLNATVSYMRRLPAEAVPGEKFLYSTGQTHLLGVLISAATRQTLSEYLSSKIWAPYGMEQAAIWSLDRTGQEMGGCCLQMTLRDFARFGQFVLEGGRIHGESIVPTDWFSKATQIQVPLWPGGGYGYGWWIFNNYSFEALGIYGQMIYIDPSRKLVVVVNSQWPEADSNDKRIAVENFLRSLNIEIDNEKSGNSMPTH